MAIKISSGESIKKAIFADALLRVIIEKIEVNSSGLPPISGGPSVGILAIPEIDGFEATWRLKVIGTTGQESSQLVNAFKGIFPGSTYKVQKDIIHIEIFSLVTSQILDTVEKQKKIKKDLETSDKLQKAIEYANTLKNGTDGRQGQRGEPGPAGLKGDQGEQGEPGKDGKDLVATDAQLNDLQDVFAIDPKIGQVLTWDGSDWVALFVPQISKYAGSNNELDCGDFGS